LFVIVCIALLPQARHDIHPTLAKFAGVFRILCINVNGALDDRITHTDCLLGSDQSGFTRLPYDPKVLVGNPDAKEPPPSVSGS
jgi:hypothetical protein